MQYVFVCFNIKSFGQILMKFSENVGNGRRNRAFKFGVDPDHCLDPGICLSLH